MKIRWKIVLLILTLMVFMSAVITAFTGWRIIRHEEDVLNQRLGQVSVFVSMQMQSFFERSEADWQLAYERWRLDDELWRFADGEWYDLDALRANLCSLANNFHLLSFVDAQAREMARCLNGRSVDPNSAPVDWGASPLWEAAAENPDVVNSVPVFDRDGKPVSGLARAIQNPAGSRVGVLIALIDVSPAAEMADAAYAGRTGAAILVNRDGVVFSRREFGDGSLYMQQVPLLRLWHDDGARQNDFRTATIGGVQRYARLRTLISLPGQQWTLAVVMDRVELMDRVESTLIFILILAGVVCLIGIAAGFVFSGRIMKPVYVIGGILEGLAQGEGDLTRRVDYEGTDEMGAIATLFNDFLDKLTELVKDVANLGEELSETSEKLSISATETSKASEQISAIISGLAGGANDQAVSIEKFYNALQLIREQIDSIQNHAEQVKQLSRQSSETATTGRSEMTITMKQLGDVMDTVNFATDAIRKLGERSLEIGAIVDMITRISSQTNLLALNAAIEAARAGEHGMGFAVVAEEIRQLADESQNATRQIVNLIEAIQSETEITTGAMDTQGLQVSSGLDKLRETAEHLTRLDSIATSVFGANDEMVKNVTMITELIKRASNNMQNLQAIAEESASSTEQVAATSEEQTSQIDDVSQSADNLARMAAKLQTGISRFKFDAAGQDRDSEQERDAEEDYSR